MSGLFGALEIARRGLLAGQAGLAATSQNVANANTPGYTRKVIRQSPASGPRLPEGIVGSGVDVRRIERVRDAFLEGRLLGARADLGDAKARASVLREVEAVLGDLEDGSLSETIGAFFDAWHDLSLSPESLSVRQAVRDAGAKAAALLNRLSAALDETRRSVEASIPAEVADLNARIARVADLSRRIAAAEAGGAAANDLRDERGREVDEIAERVDVNAEETPAGRFILRVGGVVVADGERALGLTLDRAGEGAGAAAGAVAISAGGVPTALAGGTLAARLAAAGTLLPAYQERLDEIAAGLTSAVNAIHASGYDLEGRTGIAFFALAAPGGGAAPAGEAAGGPFAGSAARIRLSDAVREDPAAIAASLGGAPGDNRAALAIADAGRSALLRDGTRSLSELVSELSETVARDAGDAAFLEDARGAFVEALENRRDAVSAVSLDEEAVNLVRYQDAYEAAARVLSVANEMIDTLLAEVR